MEYLDNIIEFVKDHYILSGAIITSLVQISPIKFNPITLLGKLCQRAFKWIGEAMTADIMDRFDEVEKRFDTVEKDLTNVKDESDQRRISDIRWHIINFSDMLKTTEYEKEAYEHIFDDLHPEYLKLLEKHGLTNGKVDRAMHNILNSYKEKYPNEIGEIEI